MFKPSHLHSPRSLDECHFACNADPIERHVRPFDGQDRIVMWGGAVVAFVLVCLFIFERSAS